MPEEQTKNAGDNIKFVKELQLTTSYYTLLLFFAIIALFKIPGTSLEAITNLVYWVIGILTVFSIAYQIHIAIALWQYRNQIKNNTTVKKVSLLIYTLCFISLIILVARITLSVVNQSQLID